jgi:threonine aldolase
VSAPIDLRSDTVTRPTPAMLDAMRAAPLGDDVFGEDPTVNALEGEVATLLGKEAALFVPSGTMANQLALAVHTRPGDGVVAEAGSHCMVFESGGAAALSGLQFEVLARGSGWSDAELAGAVKPYADHLVPSTLAVVENTFNLDAGRSRGEGEMARIARAVRARGLKAHCDGARIWNAAVAQGSTERALVAEFDSVAVCFSKGLGAPVGSAFVGTREAVQRARRLRKRWGGGMRQTGLLAACVRHALAHHRERLRDDHRRASELAAALRDAAARASREAEVIYPDPGSNMVYVRLAPPDAARFTAALRERGVLFIDMGGGLVRAVTHLDATQAMVDEAAAKASEALRAL